MFVKRGKFPLPPPRKMSMGFTKNVCDGHIAVNFIIAHHVGVVKSFFKEQTDGVKSGWSAEQIECRVKSAECRVANALVGEALRLPFYR